MIPVLPSLDSRLPRVIGGIPLMRKLLGKTHLCSQVPQGVGRVERAPPGGHTHTQRRTRRQRAGWAQTPSVQGEGPAHHRVWGLQEPTRLSKGVSGAGGQMRRLQAPSPGNAEGAVRHQAKLGTPWRPALPSQGLGRFLETKSHGPGAGVWAPPPRPPGVATTGYICSFVFFVLFWYYY